ncbi:MAG: hypothetical protein R3B91_23330 [Planctomycetaceae bacterium]
MKVLSHIVTCRYCDPLDNLERLSLQECTDWVISTLPDLPNLKTLQIPGGYLSDGSVDRLSSYQSLQHLDVKANKFSLNGIEQLREQLGQCHIVSDYGFF